MDKRIIILPFLFVFLVGVVSAFNFETGDVTVTTSTTTYTGNLTNFTESEDTPSSYGGEGGDCVKVNVGETGLEFDACGSITETDPKWSANLTAHNVTWNSIFNQTYEDAWQYVINSTFSLITEPLWSENFTLYNSSWSAGVDELLWSANLTAHNDSWTSTYNATYEDAWQYCTNSTFSLVTEPLWSANLTAHNATWSASSGEPLWGANLTAHNDSWTSTYNASYIGNDTADWHLNISELFVDMFYTPTSSFSYTFDDDGSDLIMDFSSIGGTNSLFLETAGTFLEMIANPGPSNDYEMFAFEETQGADTAINFYEGGVGHNRIWSSGSVRIGADKESVCSNITSDVDCDIGSTGADLVVQDDGWFGGKLFSSDWSNVSITESQISDFQSYLTSFTELDPYWSENFTLYNSSWSASASEPLWGANLTAHNASWNLDTDTWNTSEEIWIAIDNGTFIKVGAGEPLWGANLTAHNDSWTSTFNQTYEDAWLFTTNSTFSLITEPLWSENFTLYNDSWSAGGTDTNETTRFDNLVSVNCSGTNKYSNISNDGTLICSTDIDTDTWNTSEEMWIAIDNGTFVKVGAGEPLWSANLTAHNVSWVSTFNQTYQDAWLFTINNTFSLITEPLWSANLTAHNATWNLDTDSNLSESDVEGYIFDTDNTGNLTLGQKITFVLNEIIDNIIDGWITITGGLNVTENLTVVGNITTNEYFVGDATFLTNVPAGTETDPKWSANLTAHNVTWNSIFNQTYEDAWQYCTNSTFSLITEPLWSENFTLYNSSWSAGADELLWSANLTAHNDSWTTTFNQTYEDAWQYCTNSTFSLATEPLWSANLTTHNDSWIIDTNANLTEDDVEGYIFDSDNTANLNMSSYNITFTNGTSGGRTCYNQGCTSYIYHNGSGLIIRP